MTNPNEVVKNLIKQKYNDTPAVFWAGSVAIGNSYTSRSDLDIVVVFDQIQNAYREAFLYEGWKIDAFIHDIETLYYFFEEIDKKSGMPALPNMVLDGILMTKPSPLTEKIKAMATKTIKAGPPALSKEELDRARFFITDLLDKLSL